MILIHYPKEQNQEQVMFYSEIDYFQIATLGTALDFGDSATSRTVSGGLPSSTRAVWGAGSNRVGYPSTITAITMMDYSTFASKGNAVEFGNEILEMGNGNLEMGKAKFEMGK